MRNNSTGHHGLRPCPHDTFPNRPRSIANGSRPVARVHTGETGTLIPVSRDQLATWNERARSVASDQLCRVDARVGALAKSAAVITHLIGLLPRFVKLSHWASSYLTPTDRNPNISVHLATNHWFVKNSTKSYCSPFFEAKTLTENFFADIWINRIAPGQIGIACACVYYYLSCFSS